MVQQQNYFVSKILPLLQKQSGEDKLRIAFRLNVFVDKLRAEGKKYEIQSRQRTGRAS